MTRQCLSSWLVRLYCYHHQHIQSQVFTLSIVLTGDSLWTVYDFLSCLVLDSSTGTPHFSRDSWAERYQRKYEMFVKTLFENSLAPFERITGLLTFLGVSFWYLWRSWPVWNAVWRWPWQDYQQHPRGPFGRWSNGGKFDSLLFDAMFFNVATTWNNRKRWNTMWLNVMDMVTGKKCQKHFINHNKSNDLHAKLIKLGNPNTFFLNSLISLMCFCFPHQEDSALVADIIPVSIGREMAVKVGDPSGSWKTPVGMACLGNLYGCLQK